MSERFRSIYQEAVSLAESDPNVALFKLRWCAEELAKRIAENSSIQWPRGVQFDQFIDQLRSDGAVADETADKLDRVRIIGNRAVHEMTGAKAEVDLVAGYVRDVSKQVFPGIDLTTKRAVTAKSDVIRKNSLRSRIEGMHRGQSTIRRSYKPSSSGFLEWFVFRFC